MKNKILRIKYVWMIITKAIRQETTWKINKLKACVEDIMIGHCPHGD